ncbi:MAG TPA: hypothetical protein VIX37_02110 [Candidatus Sulfotelmatobacter sp.]
MPIEVEVRHEAMGVIYRCRGAMVIADFFAANQSFLATPEEIRKWRYTLVDLTAVDTMDINFNDVSRVVTQNATIAANAVPGVLLAVASPRDHGYALSRMWEALVERVGWETMTFRSIAEAETWIRTRLKQKFDIELPACDPAPRKP